MNEMTRVDADHSALVAAQAERPESFSARFTRDEFLRMIEHDVFPDAKIEMIAGELYRMPPPGNKHGLLQIAILKHLIDAVGMKRVRAEQGIDLGDDTIVGCDALVLNEPLDTAGMLEPADLLMVVEVSESTLRRDTGDKRVLYACAGIPLYWVIDVRHAVVRVHAEPVDGEYTHVRTVRFGEPLAVPGTDATITLS